MSRDASTHDMSTDTKILLVQSTQRHSERLAHAAVEEACKLRDAGQAPILTLIYIDEPAAMRKVSDSVRSQGFLGEEACERILIALEEEQQRLAGDRVSQTREIAAAASFELDISRVSGDYASTIIRCAERQHYDVIYMVRAHRSRLRRVLKGSEVDEVVRYALSADDRPEIRVGSELD